MKMSPKGRALTEQFESLRLTPYQDQRGVWTVGYGHTGADVVPGQSWTVDQCEIALESDVAAAEAAINHGVSVSLNQNQFDALCDFTFNVGVGNFGISSLRTLLNQGRYKEACAQFAVWNKVRIAGVLTVSPGLSRRRAAEAALFSANPNT
jgi:lysozyme